RSHFDRLVRDNLLRLQTKLIHFDVRRAPTLAFVNPLRDEKDGEEDEREGDAADGCDLLRDQVDTGYGEQERGDDAQSDGNLFVVEIDVQGHFPFARAAVFEAQDEYRQRLERKRPDDAERISLAQHIDVAARADDR